MVTTVVAVEVLVDVLALAFEPVLVTREDFLGVVAVVSGEISTKASVVVGATNTGAVVGGVTKAAFVVDVGAVVGLADRGIVVDVTWPMGWMLAVVLVANSDKSVDDVGPTTPPPRMVVGAVATTCPNTVVVGPAVVVDPPIVDPPITDGGHGNS